MPKLNAEAVVLTSASINGQLEKIRALLNIQIDADNVYTSGDLSATLHDDACLGLATTSRPVTGAKFFEHTRTKLGLGDDLQYEINPNKELFMEFIKEARNNREFTVIRGSVPFIHNKDSLQMTVAEGEVVDVRDTSDWYQPRSEKDVRVTTRSMSGEVAIPKPVNFAPVSKSMARVYYPSKLDLSNFYESGGYYGYLNVYVDGVVGDDSEVAAEFAVTKIEPDRVTATVSYSVSNIFNDDRITIMIDYVLLCEVLK